MGIHYLRYCASGCHFCTLIRIFWLSRPLFCQPASAAFEPWGCSKDYKVGRNETLNLPPKWHISSQDELSFANELLELHFQSALDDLSRICETRIHTNAGEYAMRFLAALLSDDFTFLKSFCSVYSIKPQVSMVCPFLIGWQPGTP